MEFSQNWHFNFDGKISLSVLTEEIFKMKHLSNHYSAIYAIEFF